MWLNKVGSAKEGSYIMPVDDVRRDGKSGDRYSFLVDIQDKNLRRPGGTCRA